jgi:hypothetical protein
MLKKIIAFISGTFFGGFFCAVALVCIYAGENIATPPLGFSLWVALLILFKPTKRKEGEPDLPSLEVASLSFFVSLLVYFPGYHLIRFFGFL